MTRIIEKTAEKVVLRLEIPLGSNMLGGEEQICRKLNEAGVKATECLLEKFDADGAPLEEGGVKYYSKGKQAQNYETPYGIARVERHTYQNSSGGKTACPLEKNARIVLTSTPRFAKIVSGKYGRMSASEVISDLGESLERKTSDFYVKTLSDYVGSIAQGKESYWNYALPELKEEVKAVGIGLDGTCMLLKGEGWREAETGTISLYDGEGERLHTVYAGSAPEHGKGDFKEKFRLEIERIKKKYPDALYLGLADGSKENWSFLAPFVARTTLDFYHVSEYVKLAAPLLWGGNREESLSETLHNLKHKQGSAKRFLNRLEERYPELKRKGDKETLMKVITYFRNNCDKMNYGRNVKENLPIGSGVTEAACKVLIKQRFCKSGMRWRKEGASLLITLRSLLITKDRWEQFWGKINQFGIGTLTS